MNRGVRIVLSVDMEGISQIGNPHETLACRAEYWATGKPRMEAETAAAAEGLLAAGATEVIVLDNHGSGNPENVSPECLPAGTRLETWNVFDLPAHDVDGMLQVGYHARGGVNGFHLAHLCPGLAPAGRWRTRLGESRASLGGGCAHARHRGQRLASRHARLAVRHPISGRAALASAETRWNRCSPTPRRA